MSRRLVYTMAFEAPAPTIYTAYTRREYWQALVASYDYLTPDSEITGFRCDETGIDVAFRQVLPRSELPAIVRAVLPLDMAVTRTQHFDSYDPSREAAGGGYTASVPHAPGQLDGSYALTSTGTGSQLQLASTCKVAVPLLGGKLEDLILHCIKELFIAEEAFTADWIAKHS